MPDPPSARDFVYAVIAEMNLLQVSDAPIIEEWINAALATNPKEVARYLNGELKLIDFLHGQVMKFSDGKANPVMAKTLLEKRLGSGEHAA